MTQSGHPGFSGLSVSKFLPRRPEQNLVDADVFPLAAFTLVVDALRHRR
jgi:hypothetical protein